MPVGQFGHFPTPRCPDYKTFFDEERLIDFLKSTLVLPNCCGYSVCSHRTTLELGNDGFQDFVVYGIQSPLVYVQGIQGVTRYLEVNNAIAYNLGKVSYPAQKRIGYTWSTPAPECNLVGSLCVNFHFKY